jgi:type II restriction/modification system DNA methylase subunit YeeA
MNRSALKTYAPKARLDFIRAVTDRAAFFGLTPKRTEPMQETGDVVIIGGRAFPKVVAQQRRSLEARIQRHGFDQVMEAMAYTWFNRFVALRYMELHGYLDHGYRVLSHPDESKTTPEIVEHAEHVTLPGLDAQQVINLKLDGTKEAELYRLLLVAQCNALHQAMPFLFEKIADETELLLPDNLLHSDSVIRKLVNEIEEADWQQVEIIGWLYQFYISDKKDEVIGKVVKSEDIPAATQLFTPNWIVKYLVQNTLGRQWLATYPDSPLRQQMQYYIEPAAQTEDVKAQLAAITPKSLDPETLTLLDDACGSGHILVEAYDLFKAIYQERGYRSKDIPRLILQKNLFGLEIDDRAAQLAAFALLMKARADDRRIFADRVQPHVVAIQESKGLEGLLTPDPGAASGAGAGDLPFADSDLFPDTKKQLTLNKPTQGSPLAAVEPCLRELIKLFVHGKTFGSLIRVPQSLASQLPAARLLIETMIATGQLWDNRVATLLLPLVKQAELLATSYDAVVTNPPYMGAKYFDPLLKVYIGENYAESKADSYACFIERNTAFAKPNGLVGMITIPNWMFLSSFEGIRKLLLRNQTIDTFVHNGRGVFGSDFGSCSFVLRNLGIPSFWGTYRKLFERPGEVSGNDDLEQRFFGSVSYRRCSAQFKKIPTWPLAFWATDSVFGIYENGQLIEDIAEPRKGLDTGDNSKFLRLWHEVSSTSLSIFADSGKWFPCQKGGPARKWYGNHDFVVDWEDNGKRVKAHPKTNIRNERYYFRQGATWSTLTISRFTMRLCPRGFIFESKGAVCFAPDDDTLRYIIACGNSAVLNGLFAMTSPTIDYHEGPFGRLPIPRNRSHIAAQIANECIAEAKQDWDSFENSWDFQTLPVMRNQGIAAPRIAGRTLCQSQSAADAESLTRLQRVRQLEEDNNRHFIDAYGLNGEVAAEVPEDQVTLHRPDRGEDMQRLISYSIGCMMGRYSLDKLGLVYARSCNEGFDPSQYGTFPADADGIIPVTELAWFPDDATERFVEFIAKAWPREHLEQNLKFIADSLGPNRDEHPRDTIRRYLATGFFKDHLSTYKKRPIYWLFSSGKQRAFQCLVYLHRYHEGTLARMRTEYVIPLQGKIAHRIEQLAGDITAATSTSHRRKLEKEKESLVKQSTELAAFDEKLRHYADQRIALDLDDGVKVNYAKFGDLLAEMKAVTGGTEE